MLWAWILLRHGVLDTTLCDKVFEWLAAGRWFSPGILVSSTNKTDRHDITEILLKVVLNTITLTPTGERTQKICQTWGEHILKVHCITGTGLQAAQKDNLFELFNQTTCTYPGFSICFKSTSTSLFTGGTFIKIWTFSWISYTTLFKIWRYQIHF
jgi:hypothetical protein